MPEYKDMQKTLLAEGMRSPVTRELYTRKVNEEPAPTPAPVPVLMPQLFLVEHYQISTYRGNLLRGDLLASLKPLMPHSSQKIYMYMESKSKEQQDLSSSVFDSQSDQSAQQFNQSVSKNSSAKESAETYKYAANASFHGDASWGVGNGDVNAQAAINGATNDVRQELASSVSQAADNQISTANSARRDKVDVLTSRTEVDVTNKVETEDTVENKTDTVENHGVFQLKQEFVTILSLIKVEVAFLNGDETASKKVPLRQLDDLLSKVLINAEYISQVKATIKGIVENINDINDQPRSLLTSDPARPDTLVVNPRIESKFEFKNDDGSVRREISVPGIVISAQRKSIIASGSTIVAPITNL
jgi:hypothetical protein